MPDEKCDCCGRDCKSPPFVKVANEDGTTEAICFTCFMEAFRGARLLPALCRLVAAMAKDVDYVSPDIAKPKYGPGVWQDAAALRKEFENA